MSCVVTTAAELQAIDERQPSKCLCRSPAVDARNLRDSFRVKQNGLLHFLGQFPAQQGHFSSQPPNEKCGIEHRLRNLRLYRITIYCIVSWFRDAGQEEIHASSGVSLKLKNDPVESQGVCFVVAKTILCIHDKIRFAGMFRSYFEERGFQVLSVSTGMEGIRVIRGVKVDAVVLDYDAPEMSGAAALEVIKNVPSQARVLILSGARSNIPPDVRHAATAVLMKVFSAPELMRSVEQIIVETKKF